MRKSSLLLGVLLLCMQLVAQQRTITGKVVDEKGIPIPGASIVIKGTKIGTTTQADGSYSLPVPSNAKALIFSSVGLAEQEISLGNKAAIPVVVLSQKGNTLTEVVVTSLGIARDKRSLGYATQSLKNDQIAQSGQVNLVSALQGKVAGVNITGASGSAGASVNINIRGITSFQGSNQPLFIVDGIPISNDVDETTVGLYSYQASNRAMDLNVNDIESVDVQKDAAATAAWGSRGANGVIYIKTKRGISGKPEFRVNMYGGVTQQPELLKTYTGAAERAEKIKLINILINFFSNKYYLTTCDFIFYIIYSF